MTTTDYFSFPESVLLELADQNDPKALFALGLNCYYGAYGEPDYDVAYGYFFRAYCLGNAEASPFLAEMLYFKQVEIKEFKTDEDYFKKAYML